MQKISVYIRLEVHKGDYVFDDCVTFNMPWPANAQIPRSGETVELDAIGGISILVESVTHYAVKRESLEVDIFLYGRTLCLETPREELIACLKSSHFVEDIRN